MKRKLATLLAFALTVTFACGCGGDSQTGTSSSNKKIATLSEYLSKEKTICYVVSEMDKSQTPKSIYFFEDGKLTIIPGSEVGLTLGDLSQMKDKEIWENYEKIKPNYAEKYSAEKGEQVENRKNQLESKIDSFKNMVEKLNDICATYPDISLEDVIPAFDIVYVDEMSGYASADDLGETIPLFDLMVSPEWMDFLLGMDEGVYEIMFGFTSEYKNIDELVAIFNEEISKVEKERDALGYKGPFFDMPFCFAVETDASGNNVMREKLVYPTIYDEIDGTLPTQFYNSLDFGMVEGADIQIYETRYNCMGLDSGNIFCTRDSMRLDTVDSKNISIDLTSDELNELFKEEVTARYE